jgi:hypothetical protein
VIRRGRLLSGVLLLSALVALALTAGAAQANHSILDVLSQGTINGNGAFVPSYPVGGSSLDGEHAFFETDEKLVAGDTDNSFDVYQRFGGTTTRESFGSIGGNGDPADVFFRATSDSGAHVFFETDEKLESGDNDSQVDIYDRFGGATNYISEGTGGSTGDGPYDAFLDAISTDGTKAFFTTGESLVGADSDSCFGGGCDDIYQRSGGVTTLVSTNTAGTANGAFNATFVGGSSDGSKIFFETDEALPGTGDSDTKIDVYERSGGTTTLVSTNTAGNANGTYDATFEGTSSDGSKVFFTTGEPLDAGDTDDCDPTVAVLGCTDVYQRSGGTTTLVSTNTAGNANGAFNVTFDANSTDGSRAFFNTNEVLAGTDGDVQSDIYQRLGTTTTQISTGSTGGNGAFGATFDGISADGTRVFFDTVEKLENPPDTDSVRDVYSRSGSTTTLISIGSTGGNGAIQAFYEANSLDGARVFISTSEKLENPPDTDSVTDVYERFSGMSLISIGPNGGNGPIGAFFDGASPDGAHVFFSTTEILKNPPDTDSQFDIYDAGAATGYARPIAAKTAFIRLVPAFVACTSANATHSAPLSSPSCNPPVQTSGFLTLGAPDVTGTPALTNGSINLTVQGETPINVANGDQADITIDFKLNDVRNKVSPFAPYSGEVRGVLGFRITDKYNGSPLTAPGTSSDLDIPFNVTCSTGTCNVLTSLDTLTANTVRENKRGVWAMSAAKVFDGGSDGDVDTPAGNTLFMDQGTFAP